MNQMEESSSLITQIDAVKYWKKNIILEGIPADFQYNLVLVKIWCRLQYRFQQFHHFFLA